MNQQEWEALTTTEQYSKIVLAISEYAYGVFEVGPYKSDKNSMTHDVIRIAEQEGLTKQITQFINQAYKHGHPMSSFNSLLCTAIVEGCDPIIESVAGSSESSISRSIPPVASR